MTTPTSPEPTHEPWTSSSTWEAPSGYSRSSLLRRHCEQLRLGLMEMTQLLRCCAAAAAIAPSTDSRDRVLALSRDLREVDERLTQLLAEAEAGPGADRRHVPRQG